MSGAPSLCREAVVLASASTARLRLLEAAGLKVVVRAAAIDETEIKRSCRAAGLDAAEVAEALAETKARRSAGRLALDLAASLVIGADQMLDADGAWFDKPATRAEAQAQLRALSGRRHRLISAAVIMHNGVRLWHHIAEAFLTLRPLSDDFIEAYLDAEGPAVCDTVGAYRVEGLGAQLFARIDGDSFTIQGLPLLPLLDFLRARGILPT